MAGNCSAQKMMRYPKTLRLLSNSGDIDPGGGCAQQILFELDHTNLQLKNVVICMSSEHVQLMKVLWKFLLLFDPTSRNL